MTENLLTMSLTTEERAEFARLEAEYFAGIKEAEEGCYRARHALLQIKEQQLYRETHRDWDAYRLDMIKRTRQRVHQILQWAEVEVDASRGLEQPIKLTNRQATALARVPRADRARVLQSAQESAETEAPSPAIIALEAEINATPLMQSGDPEEEEANLINRATEESRERARKSMTRDRLTLIRNHVRKLKILHAGLPDVADAGDQKLDEYLLIIDGTGEIL